MTNVVGPPEVLHSRSNRNEKDDRRVSLYNNNNNYFC